MTSRRGIVRLTAYWGFIVLGVGTTLLGPALLSILGAYHISPSGAGALFVAATLGYTCAVLVGGPAGDHWGRQRILRAGAALYALGLAGFALAPNWPLAVLVMAVAGMGSGIVDSGTNALANDIASPEGHATEQSVLHAFFGLGALIGPLIIGAFLASSIGWRPAYALNAVAAALLLVLFTRIRLAPRPARSATISARAVLTLARNRLVVLLALIIGLYVGAELLVGDWAATYLQRTHHLDKAAAAASIGLYWGGLAAGRLLSALASRRYGTHTLLLATNCAAFLASLALTLAPSAPVALLALAACGLAYAAVFPLVMAIAGEIFPDATGSVAGLLTAAASLAGAVFPLLGGIAVQALDARAALALSLPATFGVLMANLALRAVAPGVDAEGPGRVARGT